MLKKIYAIDAGDIPGELTETCFEIDCEFPLHYSNGIVSVNDDGNAFSEWLKTQGFDFEGKDYASLAVWGT